MTKLEWTPELGVGIVEIDEQHKRLFELINLSLECFYSPSFVCIKDVVNQLIDYTTYHFTTEDSYMDHTREASIIHRCEHEVCLERIREFSRRATIEEVDISLHLYKF